MVEKPDSALIMFALGLLIQAAFLIEGYRAWSGIGRHSEYSSPKKRKE